MKYNKTIILKNGMECLLRHPNADDAEIILQHLIQTSDETDNMARYSDEITMTVEQEREYLTQLEANPKAIMISAIVHGCLVANAGFNPVAPYDRYKHRTEFGISIKKDYWGMGIGSAVLSAIIEMAREAQYEQLELEVVSSNERAIALYKKYGFQIYGTREKSFRYRNGSYAAEYLMLLKL